MARFHSMVVTRDLTTLNFSIGFWALTSYTTTALSFVPTTRYLPSALYFKLVIIFSELGSSYNNFVLPGSYKYILLLRAAANTPLDDPARVFKTASLVKSGASRTFSAIPLFPPVETSVVSWIVFWNCFKTLLSGPGCQERFTCPKVISRVLDGSSSRISHWSRASKFRVGVSGSDFESSKPLS